MIIWLSFLLLTTPVKVYKPKSVIVARHTHDITNKLCDSYKLSKRKYIITKGITIMNMKAHSHGDFQCQKGVGGIPL